MPTYSGYINALLSGPGVRVNAGSENSPCESAKIRPCDEWIPRLLYFFVSACAWACSPLLSLLPARCAPLSVVLYVPRALSHSRSRSLSLSHSLSLSLSHCRSRSRSLPRPAERAPSSSVPPPDAANRSLARSRGGSRVAAAPVCAYVRVPGWFFARGERTCTLGTVCTMGKCARVRRRRARFPARAGGRAGGGAGERTPRLPKKGGRKECPRVHVHTDARRLGMKMLR
jgi:hypothetical protein